MADWRLGGRFLSCGRSRALPPQRSPYNRVLERGCLGTSSLGAKVFLTFLPLPVCPPPERDLFLECPRNWFPGSLLQKLIQQAPPDASEKPDTEGSAASLYRKPRPRWRPPKANPSRDGDAKPWVLIAVTGGQRSPGRRSLSRPAVSRAPPSHGKRQMPSQPALQALSPWSRGYAISADARLMQRPNTSRPRESGVPTPGQPVGSSPPVAAPKGP